MKGVVGEGWSPEGIRVESALYCSHNDTSATTEHIGI